MMEAWFPDTFCPQSLVHGGDGQFNGNAHVVADDGGSRTGSSPQATDGDDVRPGADYTAGDGGHIMHRRNL